jgi:hypothetical protein
VCFTEECALRPLTQVLLMGGVDTRDAAAMLKRGSDIVVATPGVLQEFVKVGAAPSTMPHTRRDAAGLVFSVVGFMTWRRHSGSVTP